GLGGLDQVGSGPAVTLARLARAALARRLVVAGTDGCPARRVTVAWEAIHVGAQLGDDHLRGALGDARNRAQKLTLALERAHALLDLCRERADRLVQVLDVRKQMGDQQRV